MDVDRDTEGILASGSIQLPSESRGTGVETTSQNFISLHVSDDRVASCALSPEKNAEFFEPSLSLSDGSVDEGQTLSDARILLENNAEFFELSSSLSGGSVDEEETLSDALLLPENNGEFFEPSLSLSGDSEDEGETLLDNVLSNEGEQCPTYQLMSIVSDKQELGFVDKVHALEDGILKLSNRLLPGSVESRSPNTRIKYHSLNKICLPSVGVYGDKIMIAQMLKNMDAISDSIYAKMKEGNLEAGLYAASTEHCVVLFYWHQGNQMEEAARKNISCNFVRYLVELCDDVCVCVEEDNLLEVLSASFKQAKQERTKRLKISHVQISSNDVCLSAGFNIKIPKRVGTQVPEGLQKVHHLLPFFCQGSYRCALLTCAFKESYHYHRDIVIRVDTKQLSSKIKDWSVDYYLDFSALKNKEFVVFLEHSGLPQVETYKDFQKSASDQRVKEMKKLEVSYKVAEAENEIWVSFEQVLPEVCKFLSYLLQCDSQKSPDGSPFECLKKTISRVFGGQNVVFVGSTVTLKWATGHFERYLIESSTTSSGPILGGETVKLRGEKFQREATFEKVGTTGKGPVQSGDCVTLVPNRTYKKRGVIREVETPCAAVRRWVKEMFPASLRNVDDNFRFLCFLMSHGSVNGLKRLGSSGFISELNEGKSDLGKRMLLHFLNQDGDSNQPNSLNRKAIQDFLCYGDVSEVLTSLERAASKLDSTLHEEYEQWKIRFSEFTLNASDIGNGDSFLCDWRTLCSEVCDLVKKEFKRGVLSEWRKRMASLLQKRFEEGRRAERKALNQRLEDEENAFLREMKSKLQIDPGTSWPRRRMLIKSCELVSRYFFYYPVSELQLQISIEEIQKPTIQWKIVEAAPKKEDLEELCLNSMYRIQPSCSQSLDLLSIDPEIEEMKMVAFLKLGELLIFVLNKNENRLDLYLCPKLGLVLDGAKPIHTFRRGFDLLAFEESTRFLAMYDAQTSKVAIYRFDERYRHVDWTGVELALDEFSGSNNLTWMRLVPGKSELVLVDDTKRIRVAELHHKPLLKPRHISLPSEFIAGCVSDDGSFLFVLLKPSAIPNEVEREDNAPFPQVSVYMLGDSMSFLKTLTLDMEAHDLNDLQLKLVSYGGQIHLVVYSRSKPDILSSYVLKITSASEVLQFQELSKNNSDTGKLGKLDSDERLKKSCATLDYIYYINEKFAIHPSLWGEADRNQNFHILLKPFSDGSEDSNTKKCKEYLNHLLSRIKKDKGKDFGKYRIAFHCHLFELNNCANSFRVFVQSAGKLMGDWMMKLVCLVPIQICRAQNNGIQPLVDGLQISSHHTYADSISLANLLRFGMYDAILSQWDGNVKVISSMGKQSSGKSYLLNHLSGSLLDVAGGRCTDGVWMTIRVAPDCLYVLLDFEGLGSFERTEQEDMLLSVLNAAVSNLTIFNKKDFLLDKETEAVFHRFQDGVSLVKQDEKLFKGLFYIAIKDVDSADVKELTEEFHKKLVQICQRSKENFLTKMYRGEVEISAMPPFTRPEYYKDSLQDIALAVHDLEHTYEGGRGFIRDLKLVIAQIAAKDWTPVDIKRVAMKIDILRKNMVSAVKAGCLLSNEKLRNFDTEEEISESPVKVAEMDIDLADTGLQLAALEESTTIESILAYLRLKMDSVLRRSGKDEVWHARFQEFLEALAERRHDRVQSWIKCNTAEFAENNELQKLQLEATLAVAELKQGMAICGSKCSKCFWKCVLHKGHPSDHSCMGEHVCTEKCTYCALEGYEPNILECQSLAGHDGNHDCNKMNHTCGMICYFSNLSSNCSTKCCLKVDHEGNHKCSSTQHICNEQCSLPGCRNSCVIQIETGGHEKHVCHERYCPQKCVIKGCRRSCGYEDHFHQFSSDKHLCGSEHPCTEKCEEDGICEIITELVRQTRSFSGRRGSFEYEHVSEQNGLRRECCIPIPPFTMSHEGKHVHTKNPDAVHYCDVKCKACGYFCHRHKNHSGLHNTVHGNMRNVRFCSEKEDFDIQERKYSWGESGVAEMCNMHCKAQGRGHIHLIRCPTNDNSSCTSHLYNGSRHETREYGPDVDVPKDELTHEAYWEYLRFEDPCTEEDQKEFALCNHICMSEEHRGADGTFTKSYCIGALWHEPLTVDSVLATGGHVTQDGHAFPCNHIKIVPHHVIFVIDKSGSMDSCDIHPTMNKFTCRHDCRLGCVYEAILRFIRKRRETCTTDVLSVVLFDSRAIVGLELKEMNEDVVDELLAYKAGGATSYSWGLQLAEDVLVKGCKHPNYSKMKPIIIFLSDGGNNDGLDPLVFVNSLKKADPRTVLHTIMFGTDPARSILEQMAAAGNGTFQLTLDEVQLARSFESLAASLRPPVAALV